MSNVVAFTGDVPRNYDQGMGPVVFEPYALDLITHLRLQPGMKILELAAGTGRVTRHLAENLPADARLTATDLNADMLAVAQSKIDDPRVSWQVANAMELPFPDASFDLAVCQFGVMFFPDKVQAFREARRVLKSGSSYVLSVWRSLEDNPWTQATMDTTARLFPEDPPGFMAIPFAYHDADRIRHDLSEAGFTKIDIHRRDLALICPTAEALSHGMVSGTPLGNSIRERGIEDLGPVIRAVTVSLSEKFGTQPLVATMSAWVIEAS
jgi:SAM-dependent methyltransferase